MSDNPRDSSALVALTAISFLWCLAGCAGTTADTGLRDITNLPRLRSIPGGWVRVETARDIRAKAAAHKESLDTHEPGRAAMLAGTEGMEPGAVNGGPRAQLRTDDLDKAAEAPENQAGRSLPSIKISPPPRPPEKPPLAMPPGLS